MIVFALCLPVVYGLMAPTSSDRTDALDREWANKDDMIPVRALALTVHNPIFIDGDTGFTNDSGVVWGSGTVSDPYVIAGWDISASTANGIEIRNTNAYFIISDCYVHDGADAWKGICLFDIVHGTVTANTCSNDYDGMYIGSSNGNVLSNNTCSSNLNEGIWLNSSSSNTLSNNTCFLNARDGIGLSGSTNNILIGSNCSANRLNGMWLGVWYGPSSDSNLLSYSTCSSNRNHGILLESSSNNTLISSVCSGNRYGIKLYSSSSNTLNKSDCNSNYDYGILLDSSSNENVLADNTCGLNSNYGVLIASSDNNILTKNTCSSNGLDGINLYSSDGTLLSNTTCVLNNDDGIELYSSYGNDVRNSTCSNNWRGLHLDSSSNSNTLSNNNCSANNERGILLRSHCVSNMVSNNICSSNWKGICLDSSSSGNSLINNNCSSNSNSGMELYSSSNGNILSNNTCWTNAPGIVVYFSSGNSVSNNTCSGNVVNDGIWLSSSDDNILRDNNCSSNGGNGIWLDSSSNNEISWNHLCNNLLYAVDIASGSGNIVWNNTFYDNDGSGSVFDPSRIQTYDDGTNNRWNSSGYGNHWSDWTAPDAVPPFGVVDWPYNISGSAGAKDYYPLTKSSMKEFNVNLVKGWNFVSVPLAGYGYKASTLGLLTDDVVSGWNSTSRLYDKNYLVNRSPIRNDFTIAESTGYWIYANAVETLHLFGTVPTATQNRTITVLGGGWAIVGFLGLNTSRHASDVPKMYSGGTITTVAAYNTTTGFYNVFVGPPRTDFWLVPGQALWCYCTASGTLTYDP